MATNVGTLLIDVRYNTGDLGRRLGQDLGAAGDKAGKNLDASLAGRLKSLGTTLGNVGRQMTVGLTLPLVAFGRQATQSFLGFDKAMTQINALVGVNRATTNVWRDDVRSVGTQYGIMATDAAQALYFITSSGVAAADAMGVLEVAAKASAVGLGTIQTTSDVVTSAINAYGKESMSAAKAADILTVAVREGKGEADKLGGALSAVIPIASAVDVSFGEVAGAMSAMTLSGTTADEAATQLRGILNTLQDMPPIAQRALKAYTGLDYATLRANLSSKGLIPTLKQITDAFKGNEAATAEVFGNVRALTGVYNLFGEKEEQTLSIVRQSVAAQGDLNRAYDITAESAAFKLQQARAQIDAAMVDIGSIVVPVFEKVATGTAYMLNALSSLGPVAGTAVAVFASMVAAAGPLVYMFSSVLRVVGGVGKAYAAVVARLIASSSAGAGAMAGFLTQLQVVFAAIGPAVIAGLATALITLAVLNHELNKYDKEWEKIRAQSTEKTAAETSFESLEARLQAANKGLEETQRNIDAIVERRSSSPGEALLSVFDFGSTAEIKDLENQGKAYQQTADEVGRLLQLSGALASKYGLSKGAALGFVQAQDQANHKVNTAAELFGLYDNALRENDPLVQKTIELSQKQNMTWAGTIAKAKETSDAFFGLVSAEKAATDARQAVVDAEKKVGDARQSSLDATKALARASRQQIDADRRLADSGRKLAEARQAAADAQTALQDALRGPSADEQIDVESARLSLEEARRSAREPGQTSLERRRSALDVRRAEQDLKRAQGAHDERVATARKDVASATEAVADAEGAQEAAQQGVIDAQDAYNEAKRREADSLDAIKEAEKRVDEAKANEVKSTSDLASAQSNLNTMLTTGTTQGQAFITFLEGLKALNPEISDQIDTLIGKYQALQRANPAFTPQTADAGGFSFTPAEIDAMTFGGVAAQSVPGVSAQSVDVPQVTAQGLPLTDGRVIPLDPASLPVKGGDGGVSYGDINVYEVSGKPRQTAYEVRRELRKENYLTGGRL